MIGGWTGCKQGGKTGGGGGLGRRRATRRK